MDFDLGDFLTQAGSIYSAHEQANAASDISSAAQANAQSQAVAAQAEKERNAALLKWGLIGGGVLVAVVILIIVVKKLR